MKPEKPRTLKQNDAIHMFCSKLATELNGKGKYMNVVLKPTYELRWDTKSAKENLFKPLLKAMYNKDSSTELTTDEVTKVHEQLMLMLVEKFPEIDFVEFPSEAQTKEYLNSFNLK